MIFRNRIEAGQKLGVKLKKFLAGHSEIRKNDLIVVGLPRGGVPVAREVARILGCKLEIICSKKIPCPGHPEYAIGAVSSDGSVVLNPDIPYKEQSWNKYIEEQKVLLLEKTIASENEFHALSGAPKLDFTDKVVIIVDDGIATGMTVKAAVECARKKGAYMTILAAPVMSSESFSEMHFCFDDIVILDLPPVFGSVGQFYQDFTQTTNEEVVTALRDAC